MHLTTLSHWALVWDIWLVYSCLVAFETSWTQYQQYELATFVSLSTWMFLSKFIKFTSHYHRYPLDLMLIPVSIGFGYFHGLIKFYALCTLTAVSPPKYPCSLSNPLNPLSPTLVHPHVSHAPTQYITAYANYPQTTWGSRQGADAMDSYRMMRVSQDESRCVEKLMAESAPSPLDAVTIDRRWRVNATSNTPNTASDDPSRHGTPALYDIDEKPCSRTSSSNALPSMASQPFSSKASLIYWGEKPPSYAASEGIIRVYEVGGLTP